MAVALRARPIAPDSALHLVPVTDRLPDGRPPSLPHLFAGCGERPTRRGRHQLVVPVVAAASICSAAMRSFLAWPGPCIEVASRSIDGITRPHC
jgi:hypothetical protein